MLKKILKNSLPMMGTRALNMAMPVVDMIIVTNIFFLFSGSLLLASQLIQIFVVMASSMFVGVNILLPKMLTKNPKSHNACAPLIIGISLGILCTLLAPFLAVFSYDDTHAIYASIILAAGLIPLFGYSALITHLESLGFEKRLVCIGWYSNILNIIVSLFCVYFLENPVIAVCLGTTIVRTYMFIHAFAITHQLGHFNRKNIDRVYLSEIIRIGTPEAVSKIIFVAAMTFITGTVSTRLPATDFSLFSVVLSYMNFLLVISVALGISLSINFSKLKVFPLELFIKTSFISSFIFYIVSVMLIPIAVFIFGKNVSLMPILFIGTCIIFMDLINMCLIIYFRLMGYCTLPPYSRLILLFTVILYVYSAPDLSATTLLHAFFIGNIAVFTTLLTTALILNKRIKPIEN